MFFDASQAQQATYETSREPEPVKEAIEFGLAFLVGRAVGGWLKNLGK